MVVDAVCEIAARLVVQWGTCGAVGNGAQGGGRYTGCLGKRIQRM